ncbi:hypothetical protein THAOC_30862, partial [Thalassiosira oceanica]
ERLVRTPERPGPAPGRRREDPSVPPLRPRGTGGGRGDPGRGRGGRREGGARVPPGDAGLLQVRHGGRRDAPDEGDDTVGPP